ncbi:DMT family transporter [Rheinheimera sp.]|uniref:DMT family transporter n=1 Tax=Rheinheimera sp. TaxID=1869214 RepID=UPI00307EE818
MHQSSGRVWLGFSLALVTAVLWGILPLALKWLLSDLTPASVTWIRFLVAAMLVSLMLVANKQLHFKLTIKGWCLLGVAASGLLLNYILYLSGLSYLSAETAQVLIQLAPFLMMIGAVFIFKEPLLLWQKFGAVVLLIGLLLFFNDRLLELLLEASEQSFGLLLVLVAAFSWAAYALAQKQLLMQLKSQQVMWLIYILGAISFFPATDLRGFSQLSTWQWAVLAFCCMNTVIAYGAFAEALQHWQASNVSAVLAITPLLTIAFAQLLSLYTPAIVTEDLNALAWIGAVLVVLGSAMTALAPMLRRR